MSLGFVMLCHTALERAAEVARHWAERGCPVVIHIDRATPEREVSAMQALLADLDTIRFSPRHSCEWGTWGIVAATIEASAILLRDFPEASHIYLVSGSCLPLRPVEELQAYLALHPGTDFIESVTTSDVGWTVGGLNAERFTLRFPFSWRKNRWLFDSYVQLQRRLRMRRKLPRNLVPHLGSQWWCLTRETLSALIAHPDRAAYDRWFRRAWIPDESYFQSLVRLVSPRIESRSLTLSKFDYQGKPHVFYDDHLQLLRRSDCFVARKIWPRADKLYRSFLDPEAAAQARAEPNPGKIDRLFAKAVERRISGRPGLYMQSRFPNSDWLKGRTAAPFAVFEGFAEIFEDFGTWLSKVAGTRAHGHLFAPERVEFAGGARVYNGSLSDSAALRDYNPRSFLTSLIWNTRGERQCFQFSPADNQEITPFLAGDPNAQIWMITGAFAVPLFRSGRDFSEIRAEAARLQRIESAFLTRLRAADVKAKVRIWNLAELVENPEDALQSILDEVSPRSLRRLSEVPQLVDMTGFGAFLQNLRNQGMKPELMGDYSTDPTPGSHARPRARSYTIQ
ncbi:beta-1,6-N-acetylglucosaminyltransferase [Pseudogemmobacter faecipullorum]|uniref:Peptide O-xylosyltransferase n=1 Tax=Pseudogemmobacter faecipullorum TaxID=2755041 RepID=A0ABS8CHJ8_9RHOB|nr:beta-1,6-N-acetylglucosaminyltransferase [Pseudogemmobacter faecipullorum]MCB5408857.1 glycosyl transferase [Pseudogemmobacter faecipullorum]